MPTPILPADEVRRRDLLGAYDALDESPDRALDDLAALAAQIGHAPIGVISFVDDRREWFKARVGLSIDATSRASAFGAATIAATDALVVPDTAVDARFAANPLVDGAPHVRFYAGVPLRTLEGVAIGTIAVMDIAARDTSEATTFALEILARQVMSHLDRRRQARELTDSQSLLLKVYRNCPAALSITRWTDRTFVDVNAAFTELLGWTRIEVVGKNSLELGLVLADAAAEIREQLTETHVIRDQELSVHTRAGEVRRVLIGIELLDFRGELHALTTFVDITARKEVEIAASRLAAIVESSDDAIIGTDLDAKITSWNTGAEHVFGYGAAEMIGAPITRLIPPDRADDETLIIGRISRGESVAHFETLRRTKDGRTIDVSITASPIRDLAGRVVGMSKIARDITARRRIEAARRESEGRYRALFDYAPDGILIADSSGRYVDANASVCGMLGYERHELIGLDASYIVESSEQQYIMPALETIRGRSDYHREWLFRRRDRSTFPVEVIASMMPDGYILALVRDVNERNRNEARFRRLVDSNAQGVMFWGADGQLLAANDAFLRIIGYTRADLEAGRIDLAAMTPQEYVAVDLRAREELVANGVCAPYEKEYVRADGTRVWVLVGAASFADNPAEGVAFVLDLTERKTLERQFFRAQRMESIGTLAGGIAHDLNNVLAPILLSVALVKAEVSDQGLVALLDTVEACAQRGAELVQQVLSFARGVEGRHVLVNPRHLMRDLLNVMRDTFPRSIRVEFEPPHDLWTVTGDPTQMHQVFLNLFVNARDAMPHGGRLTITMENTVVDETYAALNIDARPGSYVVVTISDTGTGIPADLRDRIFEPFFTTKEVGKGTGLGLSTTLAIVRSHGGFIHVYSEVGQGTKFKVYWTANRGLVVDEEEIAEALPPRGNGELILVVDDEPSVRGIARATLERFGYRVVLAANGAEAVAVYAVRRSEIAAVLTDMAMPIMDGAAMIVALKAIDPAVRVIGSSGLATNENVAKVVGAGVDHFVAKPYTAELLLKTMHDVLHRP